MRTRPWGAPVLNARVGGELIADIVHNDTNNTITNTNINYIYIYIK